MNLSTVKKFVLIMISVSLIASCNIDELEFDNLEVTPITGVFSFPLGEATYVMSDLLIKQTGDSLEFEEDSTSLYTLLYYDTITYSAPDDFIRISDIVQNGVASPPAYPGGAARQETFSASFDLTYDPDDGEELDSVFYLTGDLTFATDSEIPADIDYTYTVQNTTHVNTGTPISISGTVSNTVAPVDSDSQSASLVNHVTKLTGGNTFTVDLDVTVNLAAAQSLTGLEEVRFTLTYGNQTFGLIYGKFGQDVVQVGNQSLDIDFFSQASRDGITFGNPSLTFDFRNSFGVPVEMDFSGINGVDDSDGSQVFLSGNIVNNPPTVGGSDVNTPTPTTPGETVQTVVEINRSNSNLVNLLASAPDRLVFDVAGRSNPTSTTTLNYLQPTSQITAYVAMEIPFEVKLENYKETGTFSFRGGLQLDNVDSAFIRVVTVNELPFSGLATLEIKDADSVTLFTIADNLVINAPFINVNGEVTDPNGATTDIPVTGEQVDLLANASYMQITMTFNTPVSQTSREIYVKILADYALTLKVGIGGKFNLDL
ncbi:hypothetical protein [Ekhidna sp.]|uniref:hypothetical protein n=1 Tax=Ekhidna sp. TaxID=2608089 RepID=UPI0035176D11